MENFQNQDVSFSSTLKAGRRTYFFDVKKTKNDEMFLTITESKKTTDMQTGEVKFDKHRIFLYNEDFEKFMESFNNCVDFIKSNQTAE